MRHSVVSTHRLWFIVLALAATLLVTTAWHAWKTFRTADGEEHPVDTIIYGTGFRASEYLRSVDIFGRDGRCLQEQWRDGAEAYLGITVPGFPNLFLLYGPNTNGTTSVMFMHEAQVHYVTRALRWITRRGGGSVEVRDAVSARYNRGVQAALEGTVWAAGCTNYFRAPSGKLVTQLPVKGTRYWLRTRVFDRWSYRWRRPGPSEADRSA